jgi:hypothetical protein
MARDLSGFAAGGSRSDILNSPAPQASDSFVPPRQCHPSTAQPQ